MKALIMLLSLLLLDAASAQPMPGPGVLAARETEALTIADRQAARDAEQAALDRDQPIKGFEWRGPDGASGIVMVGGEYANHVSLGRCRHFVHIVRHKDDGGLNPTFIGKVCRDWDGKWSVAPR